MPLVLLLGTTEKSLERMGSLRSAAHFIGLEDLSSRWFCSVAEIEWFCFCYKMRSENDRWHEVDSVEIAFRLNHLNDTQIIWFTA